MASSTSLDSFCVSAGFEEGILVNAVTANGHRPFKQSGEPSLTTDCRVAGPAGVGWMLLISASRLAPPVVLIEVPMWSPSRDKPLVETLRCPRDADLRGQGWESWNGRCQISMSRALVMMMSLPSPPCFPSPMCARLAAVDLVKSPRLVPDRNTTAPHAPKGSPPEPHAPSCLANLQMLRRRRC